MLHGHKADIQEILYLIQPFMLDKMGMAYALVNLSSGLGLAIDTIQQHMAYEIARNPHGHFNLCEAVTHRIVNLGYYAVRVKEMLSANRENDLSAITDWFPPDIKSEANI